MRIVKIAVGFVLLAAGIAMLVVPGPGWLTIAAALTILSTELPWARRALDVLKGAVTRLTGTMKRGSHHGEEANVEPARSRRT